MAAEQQTAGLPNVLSCKATISACERGQQRQQAMGLLAMRRQMAVLLNVTFYTAAFSACERGQQWQQALSLWTVTQLTAVLPADCCSAQ